MSKSTGRAITATVLAVLVALLAIPSVALLWMNRQVLNPDRYLATVAPLASNPEVQAQITTRVTDEVMTHLDLNSLLSSMTADLPPTAARGLQALAGPIDSAIEKFVQDTVSDFVSSNAFASVWQTANRTAHKALMSVLTGDGQVVQADNDTITVDLGPIVAEVKTRLVGKGFPLAERIPVVQTQYQLVQSPAIGKAQTWYSIFEVLRWLVPVLALVLLAVALLISPNRRRTLLIAALSMVAAMVLMGAATFVARGFVAPDTGGEVYDTLIAPLRTDIRWMLAIGLLVAVGTWLYGYLRSRRADAGTPSAA